jgi:PPOX class probable F420-dependent enzyme
LLMPSDDKIAAFLAEPRNAIVAGTRADGRPHATPNWFYWDGERFCVSTTRNRAKYRIFRRDPRGLFVVDDSTGYRTVMAYGTVEVREDVAAELPRFRAIREKHGASVPGDREFLSALVADQRVLLAMTPDGPPGAWTTWGLD